MGVASDWLCPRGEVRGADTSTVSPDLDCGIESNMPKRTSRPPSAVGESEWKTAAATRPALLQILHDANRPMRC